MINRSMASASDTASDGVASKPETPSSTSSGTPMTRVATQGRRIAIASISTTGIPSAKLASTNASEAAYIAFTRA